MENKNLVVSIVIGKKYRDIYKKYFQESHLKYAEKINADIIILENYIEKSGKHPSWQKLLIFKNKNIKKYEKVLFIDADIYICKHAKNIFHYVSEKNKIGATINNNYDIKRIEQGDKKLIKKQFPDLIENIIVINGGVLILSPEHKDMLEEIFYKYEEQTCYEQIPLSYYLNKYHKLEIIPKKFNTILPDHIEKNGFNLSKIIKLYEENYFIHSAGGINKIFLKIIIIFEKNSTILRFLKTISGFYIFDIIFGIIIRITKFIWIRIDNKKII